MPLFDTRCRIGEQLSIQFGKDMSNVPPIPNIALFAGSRTWEYDHANSTWRSSDGWEITDIQLRVHDTDGRVLGMLREHLLGRSTEE